MNSNCINKSMITLRYINGTSPLLYLTKSRLHNTSQTILPGLKSSAPATSKITKTHQFSKQDLKNNSVTSSSQRDSQLSGFIFSNKHDSDVFGTLSHDWKTQQLLKEMPDEKDDIIVTEFLHNKEGKNKLTDNKYAKIIKIFLRQRKIGLAIDVLETRMLKDDHAKPTNYICNLLIGACGKVGYTQKAFDLYFKMRDRGLKVTGHTYTGLFNACANSPIPGDGLKRAQKLRATLVERAVLMNQTIYHSMIKAFGRCGDLETAFLLVDEMLEKKIMVTNETFNFLLQACITDKTAGFRHALLVWRKMLDKRVHPDLFSFNLLLRCSRDCGLGDEMNTQQVIQVLLQKNLNSKMIQSGETNNRVITLNNDDMSDNVPNLITRHPTMGSVTVVKTITSPEHRLMLMGGSKGILEQMRVYRIKPDVKTITQLLDQIPSTLPDEIDLLERAKQANVSLDIDFYNMLIRKRSLRSDYENAKQVLKIIQEKNLKPNMITYGVLAMATDTFDSALQLLQDIDGLGHRPSIELLGALLKNACYSKNCDYIIKIMKTVEKEELKPNDVFLKHLHSFYKFASHVLEKQSTDNTCTLNKEKFNEFNKFYQHWRRNMKPEDPPHPWEQFENRSSEPEDLELLNYGKVKYTK